MQPWEELLNVTHSPNRKQLSCPSSGSSNFWYEEIEHNDESSFLAPEHKKSYKVFRNVVADHHADNTGKSDASGAIQNAIKSEGEKSNAEIQYKLTKWVARWFCWRAGAAAWSTCSGC